MFDVEQLKAMARDFTVQARDATDPSDKSRLIKQAQSYLLLAKNADWIQSTDKFRHRPHMRRAVTKCQRNQAR
jgi:hypothetical protein